MGETAGENLFVAWKMSALRVPSIKVTSLWWYLVWRVSHELAEPVRLSGHVGRERG
jgi:hypothetical protein